MDRNIRNDLAQFFQLVLHLSDLFGRFDNLLVLNLDCSLHLSHFEFISTFFGLGSMTSLGLLDQTIEFLFVSISFLFNLVFQLLDLSSWGISTLIEEMLSKLGE